MKDKYPKENLGKLCRLLGVTRQSLYQHEWRSEEINNESELIIQEVLLIRKLHPAIGTRKLLVMLQPFLLEHQIKIGRDGLFTLLSSYKLLVRRRKRKIATTQSYHRFRKYPNLIRAMDITGINQLWVSDITYYKMGRNFVYLSFVTDAYSRKIVGYHVAETLETIHSLAALKMAVDGVNDKEKYDIIHHSDRGVQYCSDAYVEMLQLNKIGISMTEDGDPLENAIAERINGIIKEEYLYFHTYTSKKEVEQKLQEVVDLYNKQRPHMSCNMQTPHKIHEENLPIKRLWKNYYQKNEQTETP